MLAAASRYAQVFPQIVSMFHRQDFTPNTLAVEGFLRIHCRNAEADMTHTDMRAEVFVAKQDPKMRMMAHGSPRIV